MKEIHPFINKWPGPLGINEVVWSITADQRAFAFLSPGSDVLILGSFPAYEVVHGEHHQGYSLDFFYGSSANIFWKIMGALFEHDIHSETDCYELLFQNKLSITDILHSTDRNNNGSADADLSPTDFNRLYGMLKARGIGKIITTSGGKGAVSGNKKSAAGWLRSYFDSKSPAVGFAQNGYIKEIRIGDFEFALGSVLSPSNNANRSIKGMLNRNPRLTECLEGWKLTGEMNNNLFKYRLVQWAKIFERFNVKVKLIIPEQVNVAFTSF
jgi:G:T/U-mismatch repair DNA glycosylase